MKTEIEKGKPYLINWRHNGSEYSDTMTFDHMGDDNLYFVDDSGDWLILTIEEFEKHNSTLNIPSHEQ